MPEQLRLRPATPADKEALAAFNVAVHARPDNPASSQYLDRYTRDLFERPHPLVAVDDHLLIEDAEIGRIASTVQLIRQTWSYAGLPLPVGQIELVGTDPAYRRRGLVRRLINAAHQLSAERGDLVQVIGGKPNFYRQFGYEYALELSGGRRLVSGNVLALPAVAEEIFALQPATLVDAPWLAELDRHAAARYRVACPRDAALWRYEIAGRSPDNFFHYQIQIITEADGTRSGALVYTASRRSPHIRVIAAELRPGVPWVEVVLTVLRHLDRVGAAHDWGDGVSYQGVVFGLGSTHPLYDAVSSRLWGNEATYAAYTRVADLPALLRHLAPALEQRLVGSAAEGYSGALQLSWYRGGVLLRFAQGRLVETADWMPDEANPGSVK
jgi:GNAT superfamily N-acetyltransferase